jgi:hypothetical protein
MVSVEESIYIALAFLTPLLCRGGWSALCIGRFITLGRAPLRLVSSFDGPRDYMDTVEGSKFIALAFLTPLLCLWRRVYI